MNGPFFFRDCPDGVLQTIFRVKENQVNGSGNMTFGNLARAMEELTEAELEYYGMSQEYRKRTNQAWVISWTNIEVNRLPKTGEYVVLRIWPSKKKGGAHQRKYGFSTMTGEPLVWVSSLFLMIHSDSRSLAAPDSHLEQIPIVKIDGEPASPKLQIAFPETMDQKAERTVQGAEIDKNGHLNNAYYLDWAEEILEKSGKHIDMVKRVWVCYNKELLEGDTAELLYEDSDGEFYLKGNKGTETAFLMKIMFE
ncbi:MAG: acyl-ACP thioesterase domain-containing protein [Eubacterium sp.]|jgi:medium-chain acyl-[acyl-carrier-protein] hydrolase